MDWHTFFRCNNVEMKENPYGLGAIKKGSEADLKDFEKDVNIPLPSDYCQFAMQIGPGTLSRCRIYCPTERIGFTDPRIHTGRLHDKFSQPEHTVAHNFDLKELIVFAQETVDNLWFGWKFSLAVQGDHSVYCFDEQPRAPPPRKVANNFLEFVNEVCFGPKLEKLGLKRFIENGQEQDKDEDNWSDTEDENPKQAIPEPPVIDKFFRPYPAPGPLSFMK